MNIIISQGLTKIHLNETSKNLHKIGVKVRHLSGWIPPNYFPNFLFKFFGFITQRTNLSARLQVRKSFDKEIDVISVGFAEFIFWLLILIAKKNLISQNTANTLSWRLWGNNSKRHIQKVDIFHVRSGAGQGGAIKKAKKLGAKVIADHSIAHPKSIRMVLENEFKLLGLKQTISEKDSFWKLIIQDCIDSDYILVNSDYVKETFIENNFSHEKIKVIYWGVRLDFIGLKTHYKLVEDGIITLLFVGTFDLRKGARTIVETLNLCYIRGLKVNFRLLGLISGEGKEALKALINNEMVTFYPSVIYEDVKQYLKESDIFLFPTFAEGSARAAMEAMAAGLPVITTSNCGIPITNDENGIIVPINSPEVLFEKVKLLGQNEHLRKNIGENAKTVIQNNYTMEKYTENLKVFYDSILHNN